MSANRRVVFAGNTYVCNDHASTIVLLGKNLFSPTIPDGLVVDGSGSVIPRNILVMLGNCTFDDDGAVDRVSPALVGVYLRAYCAGQAPHQPVRMTVRALVFDQALAASSAPSTHYTTPLSSTTHLGCKSLYHARLGTTGLDPRSRSSRCTPCFVLEDGIRKAAWPLVSSLPHRLSPALAAAVLLALATVTRERLMALLGREKHDIELVQCDGILRTGHWLDRATPFAATIRAMCRSKDQSWFKGAVAALAATGWVAAPPARCKGQYGAHVVIVAGLMMLLSFVAAAEQAVAHNIVLHLTAPGRQPNNTAIGPLNTLSLADLAKHLALGRFSYYGCTAGPPSAALGLLCALGKLELSVTQAAIGPEHTYTGSDATVRQRLALDTSGGFAGPPVDAALGRYLHGLRACQHDKGGVPGCLLRDVDGRPAKRKGRAPEGKEPAKRAAVAGAKTVQRQDHG